MIDAVVPPVDLETAVAAAARYPGLVEHPFPSCYVCGPQRADGLRIFPGRLPDGRTAAPFRAPAQVSAATVWAALDCPAVGRCSRRVARTCWAGSPPWSRRYPGRATSAW